jgi:hypothetical protein
MNNKLKVLGLVAVALAASLFMGCQTTYHGYKDGKEAVKITSGLYGGLTKKVNSEELDSVKLTFSIGNLTYVTVSR